MKLIIIGVELTQAIQYFGSTFPVCPNQQPCADNSIPLVGGKPTVLRIYFEGAAQNAPVTGLGVKLRPDGSPTSVSFPARADLLNVPSPPMRENEFHSVNIEIPPNEAHGRWKLMVSIFEKPNFGVGQAASSLVTMEFVERALLPIRLVRLRYRRGPAIDIPAPTVADFWSLAEGFVHHIWPSPLPVFCIVRETVEVFDGIYDCSDGILDNPGTPDPCYGNPSKDSPSAKGTTGSISEILTRLRMAEGLPNEVVYCGFYPASGASGLPSGGYGGGRTFVTPSVIPGLMAHELGHALGLPHSFDDANYPRYGSLLAGTIGEVGFDTLRPLAVEPGSTAPGLVPARTHLDVMNYGAPRWISPYNYSNLFTAIGAPRKYDLCNPTLLPIDQPFFPEIHRQFLCHYVVGFPGSNILSKLCGPKIKVQFPPAPIDDRYPRPVRATVLDSQGATIFSDIFDVSPRVEDVADPASLPKLPEAPLYEFSISVPDLADAKRLIVRHGDDEIEDMELSAAPVAFEAKAYLLDGRVPTVRVEWTLSSEEKDVRVFVRASSDNGRSWTAFNVPVGATQLDLDPTSLPPGEACLVEVLAGEHLRTTSWRSEPIAVRTGRDELIVLRPRDAATITYGEEIALSAVTTYGSGYEEIIWSSDQDGDLGTGGYQTVRLSPGKHKLDVRRGTCGQRTPGGVVHVSNRGKRGGNESSSS